MSRTPSIALFCIALSLPLAACAVAAGGSDATPVTADTSFRASGNEPGWRLDVSPAEMTLLTDLGQIRTVAPTPTVVVDGTTRRYAARATQGDLTATVIDRVCMDSMSGMPHPQTVTVAFGSRTLSGCGGEPASLLQGAEWTVLELAGAPTLPGSKLTLQFGADGRVSGKASCNRFSSKYSLTGEGLSIAPAATTRMMCDAPLMEQERKFLEALAGVRGFSIAADGALLLLAGDGSAVKASRF